MTNDIEHLLMCLLATCISCLEKCVFRSFVIYIELFVFLLLSCKISIYSRYKSLIWYVISKYCLLCSRLSGPCFFHLLCDPCWGVYVLQSFQWNNSFFFFFLLVASLPSAPNKNWQQIQRQILMVQTLHSTQVWIPAPPLHLTSLRLGFPSYTMGTLVQISLHCFQD